MPVLRRLPNKILLMVLFLMILAGLPRQAHAQTTSDLSLPKTEVSSISASNPRANDTSLSPQSAVFSATKVWVDGTTPRPIIAFQLYRQTAAMAEAEAVPNGQMILLPGSTQANWTNLDETAPNGQAYQFTVRELHYVDSSALFVDGPPDNYQVSITYGQNQTSATVTNTYAPNPPAFITVEAEKQWVNGPSARPTIWFRLYRQIGAGSPVAVPLNEAPILELTSGTTQVEWPDQALNDENEQPYIYSVREVDADGEPFVPANYSKTESGLTVTNTYVIPRNATATGTKTWVYGPAIKPTIGFRLYRSSSAVTTQVVPGVDIKDLPYGTIQVVWTDLEATDIAGNPYTFSVHEGTWNAAHTVFTEGPPTNYQMVETGMTVTNTYVSPKINVIGTKIWAGGPAARPNIQLQLYRNSAPFGSPYTLTSGITSYAWLGVDQTDQNGATFQYTIDEVAVPAYYSKSVSGMTVTNTYTGTIPWTGDQTNNASLLTWLLGLAAILPLAHWLDLKLLTRRRG